MTKNVSRDPDKAPKKPKSSASFIMLWTAAVLATAAAFIVHLSMRFETIELGYEVGAERREQRRLIEECRLLSLEAATLRQSERVEAVGRGVLQMDTPNAERIVPIVPTGEQRQTAGGVR
ncbi:MAG: cell division protein FtsL [Polyangiales bacterium]